MLFESRIEGPVVAGEQEGADARKPPVSTRSLVPMLPLIGYGLFVSKAMFFEIDPTWALLLLGWCAGAAVLAWWLARSEQGVSTILDGLERHAATMTMAMIVVVATAFIVINVVQARYFQSPHAEDTAYYSQVLWNTLHGNVLAGNVQQERLFNPPVANDLALHVSGVLLAVLLPLYALVPHFLTLLIVRDLALTLAAWPLFLLARERLGGAAGVAAAALYLANSTVIAQGFQQFTLVQLAPLPFFYALRAFAREALRPFLVWLPITLLVREDVAVTAAGFGVWALVRGRGWRWLAAAFGLPVLWWGLVTLLIQPAFGRWGNNTLEIAFAGGTPAPLGLYQVLFGNPVWILEQLRDVGLLYLYQVLRPVAFLVLLGAEGLLAAPGLVANLVLERMFYSAGDALSRFALLPVCAVVGATVVIVCRIARKHTVDPRVMALTMLLLLPSASLLDGAKDAVRERLLGYIKPHDVAALWEAVDRIPDGAPVAAPMEVLPVLSKRSRLFTLQHLDQYPRAQPEYVLLDGNVDRVWRNPERRERYVALLDELSRSSDYATVWQHGQYSLLRRIERRP
jgi:predicted membrane protein DUF2079